MVDLSISIVNWNTKGQLKDCLHSVFEQTRGISFEVFVVDNASQDQSAEMVRTDFPQVHLIANEQNKGFAAANNQAVKLAKGRYLLYLNPDTIVHPGALEKMVQFMDGHPEAGGVGCKLLKTDGTPQNSLRRYPSFWSALSETTPLGRLLPFEGRVKDYKMEQFSFDRVEQVDATCGAALMVKRDLLEEVGLMDEGYFMFIEELDLCRRISLKGRGIYFMPDAVITHLGGESRNQLPHGLVLVSLRSLMRYFNKFEGPRKTFFFKIIYKPLFILGMAGDLIFDTLHFIKYNTVKRNALKSKKRWMKIRGTVHFFRKDLGDFIFKL